MTTCLVSRPRSGRETQHGVTKVRGVSSVALYVNKGSLFVTFFRDPQYGQFKLKMFVEIFWLKIGAIDLVSNTESIAHLRSLLKNVF